MELLDVKLKHATAYHPRTDGQTERTNQTLEAYLRCYISYQQDNWVDYLPLAEFAYNNHPSTSLQQSPFYANYVFHLTFEPHINSASTVPSSEELASCLDLIHQELQAELEHAQRDAAEQFNWHAQPAPEFKVGDRVWLLRRNIKTTCPSDKLDYCKLGPFITLSTCRPVSFKLKLPSSLSRLHNVFHVSLLEPYHSLANIPGHIEPPPLPVYLDSNSKPWCKVDNILDCWKVGWHFDYFVSWKGLPPNKNSWVPLSDMSISLNELIEQFHQHMANRQMPQPPPHLLNPPKPNASNSADQFPDPEPSLDISNNPVLSSLPVPYNPIRIPMLSPLQQESYTVPTQTTLHSGCISCPRPVPVSPPPTRT
ncbi:Transposon Tf2-1 polyprotein [Ceratobasidium theobromae]|uniref:Transposon Tf2-1 polyprotein n=1 Tax=Ceratobasidium theobromae TaxID=1582974 RepID=A0A5N5Q8N5_9AGAM|nr:Transposon Tf2-1 polyprotein [Ceratobasidium theobromae]